MKNNGKKIFTVVFIFVLFVISLTTVSMYDNTKELNTRKYDDILYYFENDFQYYTLQLAHQVDPSFEIFSFSSDVPENLRAKINNQFLDEASASQSFFLSDNAFYYAVKDLTTGNTLTNISGYDNDLIDVHQYSYYLDIKYDENGHCTVSGDTQHDIFSDMKLIDFFNENDYDQYDIKVNQPRHLEIQFMISSAVNSYQGISGFVNSWEQYNAFSVSALGIGTLVLILLFLVFPVRYVSEVNPFKTIKNWNFEINLCFLTSIISLMFVFCVLISGYTLNGYFLQVLQNYGIAYDKQILIIMNFLVWFFSFLTISMGVFECKYIIVYGPWSFLKEHTFVASFFRMIKHQSNAVFDVQINSPLQKTILKYVIINGCIIVFIGVFDFYLGIIFTIIYSFIIFRSLSKQSSKIQNDYQKMMNAIHYLISEDFSQNIHEDFGVFESSRHELELLSTQFENAVQEKVKSEKLKTELISNVSHDLKTPLTCIRNYIEVLNDDQLTIEKRHEYLNKVILYANRLKTLIEDLLEISKVESGNIQLDIVDLNIADLIEQVYLQSEEFFEEKDLTVIRKYSQNKIIMPLDSQKTYRIFENLFMNISKYALPHSRAYVTVKADDKDVFITVTNISEAPMDFTSEEIMERFVRGDKSRSKQGSGLGLAIARSFTEAQGGKFSLDIDCDVFKVTIHFPKVTE